MKPLGRRWLWCLPPLLLLLSLGALFELALRLETQRRQAEQHRQMLNQLGELRALLLNDLNGSLHLASGVVSYLQARHGVIDPRELEPWLQALIRQSGNIRNIAIAPGNRISYVYPLQGNEGALGLYFPDVPEQWPTVQRVIAEQRALLDGPLELKQGGLGLIYRSPVILEDNRYWGLLSTVIHAAPVFDRLHATAEQLGLTISLLRTDQGSLRTLTGQPSLQDSAQAVVNVPVPGSQWVLAARQMHAPQSAWLMNWLRLGAWSLALIAAALLLALLFNLEQRHLVQQALAESRQRFRLAFDTAPQGIALLNRAGQWQEANPALCQLLGVTLDDLRQHALTYWLPVAEQAAVLRRLADCQQGPLQWEGQLLDHAQQPVAVQFNCAGLPSPSELIVLQCSDIRERRRLERLKSEFIATVSHELRTPLTAINGALRLLLHGPLGTLSSAQQELLDLAQHNTERLSLLINDLLDMEKLSSSRMPFNLQAHELRPLLQEAINSNRSYAEPFAVTLELAACVDCQVLTDPLRVQQVLANLLSNAVKFSRAGQTVRLSCQVSQGQAVIRVSDQGCGIPEAFHSQVFERFAQADTGNQRRVKGTGLGLAISKELVERMQGSIGFDSTPGLGTTFWFTLPLATEG